MSTQTIHQNVPQSFGARFAIPQKCRQELLVAKRFPGRVLRFEQSVRAEHQAVSADQLDISLFEAPPAKFAQHWSTFGQTHPRAIAPDQNGRGMASAAVGKHAFLRSQMRVEKTDEPSAH